MKHVLRKRAPAVASWLTPAALVCIALGALYAFSAGCGSSHGTIPLLSQISPTPSASATNATPGRGIVEGYLYRTSSGTIVPGSTATPPVAGATALAGAGVSVAGVAGGSTTDAAGHFQLTGITAGLRSLSVSPPGGSSAAFPLTVIADATVHVGDFTITRDQAVTKAKQALTAAGLSLDQLQILAAQQPLPAGVTVGPGIVAPTPQDAATFPIPPAPPAYTVPQPSWFIYADEAPGARFEHGASFVFVDAQTGDVQVRRYSSYPSINGGEFYGDTAFNSTSPDLIQNATRAAAGSRSRWTVVYNSTRAVTAKEKALDVPCRAPASPAALTRDHAIPPCTDPKLYTILIEGDPREDMRADISNMQQLLNSGKLGGIGSASTFTLTPPTSGFAPMLARVQDQFDAICAVARPCDTVFIYFSGHGTQRGYSVINRGPLEDGLTNDQTKSYIDFTYDLAYENCKACHLIITIDACFSGMQLNMLKNRMERVDPSTFRGKKVLLMASSSDVESSFGSDTASDGGMFTSSLVSSISGASGTVSLSNLPSLFDSAAAATATKATDKKTEIENRPTANGQHPQFYSRKLADGETCGTAPSPPPCTSGTSASSDCSSAVSMGDSSCATGTLSNNDDRNHYSKYLTTGDYKLTFSSSSHLNGVFITIPGQSQQSASSVSTPVSFKVNNDNNVCIGLTFGTGPYHFDISKY